MNDSGQTIGTVYDIFEIERSGEWCRAITNPYGIEQSQIAQWRRQGLIAKKDCRRLRVNRVGSSGPAVVWFYRVTSIRAVKRGLAKRRRAANARFKARVHVHRPDRVENGEGPWVRLKVALERLRVSRSVAIDWINKGCPYLKGAKLRTHPQMERGQISHYVLANQVEEIDRNRAALTGAVMGSATHYTGKEASQLTGMARGTLMLEKTCDRYGLVKSPLHKFITADGPRRRFRRQLSEVAFEKKGIDDFVKKYAVPADKSTVAAAARLLRVSVRTVHNWCKFCPYLGRAMSSASRDFVEKGHVTRNGVLLTRSDVDEVWRALRSVSRGKADGRPIFKGQPVVVNQPTHTQAKANTGGRPVSKEVEEVQKYVYERWVNGDKLAAIRAGAASKFGERRAPREDATVTVMATRYATKHNLPKRQNSA
jgi:hypothetical protein